MLCSGELKTMWETEKMLDTSIFSIFYIVFYHSTEHKTLKPFTQMPGMNG